MMRQQPKGLFCSGQHFGDFRSEFGGSKGLLNEAGITVKILKFIVRVSGHEKNAKIGPAFPCDAHQFGAADVRHYDVGKQQVDFAGMISDERT